MAHTMAAAGAVASTWAQRCRPRSVAELAHLAQVQALNKNQFLFNLQWGTKAGKSHLVAGLVAGNLKFARILI